jgi:hypothetical protein
VHEPLSETFASMPAGDFTTVRDVIGRQPYLHVHTPFDPSRERPVVYYSRDDDVSHFRIKRMLVQANGLTAGWDWRTYPGERELRSLIEKFETWYTAKYRHF